MATLFRTPEFFEVYRKLGTAYSLPVLMERLGDRGGEQSPWATAAQGDALIDRVVSIPQGIEKAGWPVGAMPEDCFHLKPLVTASGRKLSQSSDVTPPA